MAIVPVCLLGMQRTADAEIHGAAMRWLAKWWPWLLGVSFACRGLQENCNSWHLWRELYGQSTE